MLLVSSAATVALAIYQWVELFAVRRGATAACSINETINCATVWNSPFSHAVQSTIIIPIAGLGVLWGAVGFLMSLMLYFRARANGDLSTFSAAVKLWAIVGALSCVTFITASISARALCLTCLGTYALTATFTVGALFMLPGGRFPPMRDLVPAVGWLFAFTAPIFLGLLVPGGFTPRDVEERSKVLDAHDSQNVGAIIDELPLQDRQFIAYAREQWKAAPVIDASMFPVHARKGNPEAPVKLVEFTDILCGHCAHFEEVVREMESMAPEGGLSIEPRYYPLDGECNPNIKGTAGDGVRCFGAKVQICTEQNPDFFIFRRELYANQRQLDQGLILSIAKRYKIDSEQLNECVKSEATAARLREDIMYASKCGIQGTPLILLNGRTTPPIPAFLAGMIASGGNVDATYFLKLPPPPVIPEQAP